MLIFLLFILGTIFISVGIFFLIIYSNILLLGYSFLYFVYFIIKKPFMWLLVLGIILVILTLKEIKKNELLL